MADRYGPVPDMVPPRMIAEYIAKLRHVMILKDQARRVEEAALAVRGMLAECGATADQIHGYEAEAEKAFPPGEAPRGIAHLADM